MSEATTTMAWWREPTRGQWFSFAAAWCGWVLDAFDFTVFMLVMPEVAREFGVQHVATTASIALTLGARLIGSVIAGAAADRWGRRLPLLVSIVWFALCDGAVALAPSFGWILFLRTLFGLGMGAEWTAGTTLAMESWPARSRGLASGVLQGSWAIGYLVAGVVYAFVVPLWGWRALFVIAALPALLVLPMRIWVPESPDWQRAKASRKHASTSSALAAPGALPKLAWACGAMAFGFGAYYAMTVLYPTLLRAELGLGDSGVAWHVALFNIGMLTGSIACGVAASRKGVVVAIAVPALLSIPILPLYVGAAPALLAVGAVAGGALGVGFCGVVPMLLTDLFGPDVRARFVGIAYHVGAVFAALIQMVPAALAEGFGLSLGVSVGVVTAVCELALVVLILARRKAFAGASGVDRATAQPEERHPSLTLAQKEIS